MPILMANDTRAALGVGGEKCDSRTLLSEKLVFFDAVAEYKRVALDLILTDGMKDLSALFDRKKRDKQKAEERGAFTFSALDALAKKDLHLDRAMNARSRKAMETIRTLVKSTKALLRAMNARSRKAMETTTTDGLSN